LIKNKERKLARDNVCFYDVKKEENFGNVNKIPTVENKLDNFNFFTEFDIFPNKKEEGKNLSKIENTNIKILKTTRRGVSSSGYTPSFLKIIENDYDHDRNRYLKHIQIKLDTQHSPETQQKQNTKTQNFQNLNTKYHLNKDVDSFKMNYDNKASKKFYDEKKLKRDYSVLTAILKINKNDTKSNMTINIQLNLLH
jgi:hypothetical protein